MGSREHIIDRIKKASLSKVELRPLEPAERPAADSLLSGFIEKLLSIGAQVLVFEKPNAFSKYLEQQATENDGVVCAVPHLPQYNVATCDRLEGVEFNSIKTFIAEGKVGVVESGAIWVSEASLTKRILPFVCEHLQLIVSEDEVVADLEEAFQRIGEINDGYGVFIAGPSKTADIEQSLVIGAHGPLQLTVLLLKTHQE